ncbi:hypothetical protein NSND_62649 [Nitrospira sp. ND1]|nr:hypothetical protein NSND_62649 [Nitrospira sp. ND1]
MLQLPGETPGYPHVYAATLQKNVALPPPKTQSLRKHADRVSTKDGASALDRASFLWWEQPSLEAVDLLGLVVYDTFFLVGSESDSGQFAPQPQGPPPRPAWPAQVPHRLRTSHL